MDFTQAVQLVGQFTSVLAQVPWETLRHHEEPPLSTMMAQYLEEHPEASAPERAVALPEASAPQSERLAKPGCTAADETGLVLYHLQGVAEGKTSGVLALDPDHLEKAALGAEGMGDRALAKKLREFKGVLPGVRDAETAQQAIEKLKPLADESWQLGVKCGGHSIPTQLRNRANELASKVKSGEITRMRR